MSNTDSFIDEVTEEVRRDHLFKMARRYGWIAVVVIVGIVGGAAWNEWQKASRTAQAQAQGDALLAALDLSDSVAQIEALRRIEGDAATLARLLAASGAVQFGADAARAEAGLALQAMAEDTSLPPAWREIAALRMLSVAGLTAEPDQRKAGLVALAEPGRPFRLLAQEQLAMLALEEGDVIAARDLLAQISADPQAPSGLRNRASQMMVVLGAGEQAPGQDD